MITETTITELVQAHIEGSDIFLVEVAVKAGNAIRVHVDTMEGISIDKCVKISRFLNGELDRDVEDFSLEVSSPGLGAPLKVKQQYEKNVGRVLEIYKTDGDRVEGRLESIHPDHIVIKSKKTETEVRFEEIKKAKVIISFD